MRRFSFVACVAVAACAVAAGFAGCDSESATGGGGPGAGGEAEASTSTTNGGPPPSPCYGVFAMNGCTACLEDRCCSAISACVDTGNCIECLDGTVECEDEAASKARQALSDCHAELCAAKCPDPLPEAACDAPADPPSVGSCVIIGAGAQCNPVTNEGCDAAKSESCDFDASGFSCFPPPNSAEACEPCGTGDTGFCKAGYACYPVTYTCAKYCCDDGDCGSGYCDKNTFVYSEKHPVGLCLEIPSASGAGGSGGSGGAGGSGSGNGGGNGSGGGGGNGSGGGSGGAGGA